MNDFDWSHLPTLLIVFALFIRSCINARISALNTPAAKKTNCKESVHHNHEHITMHLATIMCCIPIIGIGFFQFINYGNPELQNKLNHLEYLISSGLFVCLYYTLNHVTAEENPDDTFYAYRGIKCAKKYDGRERRKTKDRRISQRRTERT